MSDEDAGWIKSNMSSQHHLGNIMNEEVLILQLISHTDRFQSLRPTHSSFRKKIRKRIHIYYPLTLYILDYFGKQ